MANSNDKRPKFPPAPTCVLCQRSLEEVGGRRLIACTQSRGVFITTSPNTGGFKFRKVFRLDNGYVLVMAFAEDRSWPPEAMERARQEAEAGYHPWYCQVCGFRTCPTCGAPIRIPVGCDSIGADGTRGPHSPMLGARIPCSNPDCETNQRNR